MTGPPFRERVLPDVSTLGLIRSANPERVSAANARVRHDWCETGKKGGIGLKSQKERGIVLNSRNNYYSARAE
jgi:hypothetical protein